MMYNLAKNVKKSILQKHIAGILVSGLSFKNTKYIYLCTGISNIET